MNKKNFFYRLKLLLTDPKNNIKKIKPFLNSRFFILKRQILETFGNYELSKPYPGHQELLKYFNFQEGFFVEVGGNDGYFQDPTYYLEKKLGWTGLIVEPLPIANDCQKNRRKSVVIKAAMVPSDYTKKTITLVDCNAMSVIKDGVENYQAWVEEGEKAQHLKAEEIEVPAKKLDEVMEEYFSQHPKKIIDLLVIDVEGYEPSVLRGFNLLKYKPQYLLIEILKEALRSEIEKYLGPNYDFIEIIGNNDCLYKLRTEEEENV